MCMPTVFGSLLRLHMHSGECSASSRFCNTACCRFVIEATVEENVQRLSGQRAAAMDLSAAAGVARGKQVGQQEPLTVR